MYRILSGQILIYILLFFIIQLKIDEVFPMSLIFLIILASYIYIGYFGAQNQTKTLNYFVLSFIGLVLFIVALVISPNYFFIKTIESSSIWLLVDLYLSPLECLQFWSKIEEFRYPSLLTYIVEIILIGVLPYLGGILKIKMMKKTQRSIDK